MNTCQTFQTMRQAGKKPAAGVRLALALLCAAGVLPDAAVAAQASPAVASAAPATAPRIYLADAIIAVVNSDVITRQELVERMRQVERRMKNQGIALPPQQEFSPGPFRFAREVAEKTRILGGKAHHAPQRMHSMSKPAHGMLAVAS